MFAGIKPPENWLFCDGSTVQISAYQALYSLIGTLYGGDGRATFALPDLRGRIPIGTGTGTGLTARALGASGGTEVVTVSTAQMPAHTHSFSATTSPATTLIPKGMALANVSAVTVKGPNPPYAPLPLNIYQDPPTSPLQTLGTQAITSAGGSAAHPNVMPSFCVNFMIATLGSYPTPAS